jgi:hypothetical protein
MADGFLATAVQQFIKQGAAGLADVGWRHLVRVALAGVQAHQALVGRDRILERGSSHAPGADGGANQFALARRGLEIRQTSSNPCRAG